MSRVTQADVLRTALVHFKTRGKGFSRDHYFKRGRGPNEHAGSACAVGGVEQAIWKLTGEVVTEDFRTLLAQEHGTPSSEERRTLYGGVMLKLNKKARNLYPLLDPDGDKIRTLEELTFLGSAATAKKRTLKVFEAVLADVDRRS